MVSSVAWVLGLPRTDHELDLPLAFFLPRGHLQTHQWPQPVREYEPVAQADEMLTHATRLDTSDAQALLDFVNQWGVLGLRGGPEGIFPTLSDEATKRFQAETQLSRVLAVVRQGWLSPARAGEDVPAPNEPTFPAAIEIPAEPVYWTGMALETIKRMAHALYELQRGTLRRQADFTWSTFSDHLNTMIGDIPRATRLKRHGGLHIVECPKTVLNVLGLALLDRATGMTRQRRCPECGSYFVPSRKNQIFCKRQGEQYCARKRAVRTWRKRRKRGRR